MLSAAHCAMVTLVFCVVEICCQLSGSHLLGQQTLQPVTQRKLTKQADETGSVLGSALEPLELICAKKEKVAKDNRQHFTSSTGHYIKSFQHL